MIKNANLITHLINKPLHMKYARRIFVSKGAQETTTNVHVYAAINNEVLQYVCTNVEFKYYLY